jgi:hypothetical protein
VPYADFGDPQSLNLYGFVGGNPASKADPDGHTWPIMTLPPKVTDWLHSRFTAENLKYAVDVKDMANDVANFFKEAQRGFNQACGCNPQPAQNWPEEDNKNNNNSQSSNTAEQGRDAQGKFTSKQPGQSVPGSAAEKKGLDAVGATKNTKPLSNGRIPDGNMPDGQKVEIKSGGSINNTTQLKEMGQGAMDETGKPLAVVPTNPNATVSKPIVKNPNIEIKPLPK